jgi:hypothetical protein
MISVNRLVKHREIRGSGSHVDVYTWNNYNHIYIAHEFKNNEVHKARPFEPFRFQTTATELTFKFLNWNFKYLKKETQWSGIDPI